ASPSPNATGHLIFNSVVSLLQLWPNTMWPAGHSIVPASIPAGTVLYHGWTAEEQGPGRSTDGIPKGPEWLAFDPEHAYIFCCNTLVFSTMRQLNLLYFDGSSAAKALRSGSTRNLTSMGTQNLVAWGELRPEGEHDELGRIQALCDWGRRYSLDGFVRMDLSIRVTTCRMHSGAVCLRMLLRTHQMDGAGPDSSITIIQSIVSGSWHHRDPGETRVHLDVSSLVTFYDPALQSLVGRRSGIPRFQHQLMGISSADVQAKLDELRDVLTREAGGGGVDWRSVTRVIIDRYASRLTQLDYTLRSGVLFANASEQAFAARDQLLVMLSPFYTTNDMPPRDARPDGAWLSDVVRRCSSEPVIGPTFTLDTPQERIIRKAIKETVREICRRLGLMWLDAFDIEQANERTAAHAIDGWRTHIMELMTWLDWSVWSVCRPSCALDEFCYLSTRPY
ncbi:hypothetical protein K488DRAFT_35988, partial [Vararia minispora EC-137]